MRKLCQSAVQPLCAHSGAPFHAGRAVFQVFKARSFTESRRHLADKEPVVRWYEQTTRDRKSIRPFNEGGLDDGPDGETTQEKILQSLEDELKRAEEGQLAEGEPGNGDHVGEGQETNELEELEALLAKELQELQEAFKDDDVQILNGEQDSSAETDDDFRARITKELEALEENPDNTDDTQMGQPPDAELEDSFEASFDKDITGMEEDTAGIVDSFRQLKKLNEDEEKRLEADAGSKEKETDTDLALLEEKPMDMSSLEVEFKLPQVLKKQIKAFNEALKQVVSNPSHIYYRRMLWINYMRCQRSVPGFLSQITSPAWQVLWQSQSAEPFYDEQAEHLLVLAEDMQKTGKHLTGTQKLLCIKAYEADGRVDEALNMWFKERKSLQKDQSLRFEFNALGVTLHCLSKQPDQAEKIALESVARESKDSGSVRLLIPAIGAWTKQGDEKAIKRAWTLYLFLRQSLTSTSNKDHRLTAEDHDDIFLSFLDAGRIDIALMVFKDLILAGQSSHYDSVSLFKSMGNGLESLHSTSKTAEELNKVSLDALMKLPRRFENKYFYASWMKRLIGMGRVDAAASVMELMYERGISPDAKHVNGIVGSWLRQGTPQQQDQALDLAWSMVGERLQVVESRSQGLDGRQESNTTLVSQTEIPKHLQRQVPSATTETFCLLLLYYASKKLISNVEKTKDLLSQAELAPNSYFMNHLVYAYANQGKPSQAWDLFTNMSQKTLPDAATYEILWKIADRLTTIYEQMDQFPGPRRLFSTMMNWYSQLNQRQQSSALDDIGPSMYTLIVRSFCKWKDLNGTLVAMYTLRDSFGLYPDEDTIKLVSVQIAQIGSKRQAPHPIGRSRVRRRKQPGADLAKNIESASKALEMLNENRKAELEEQGVRIEELDDNQAAEERLYLIAELLRTAQRKQLSMSDVSETQELSEEFDQVAWEMGAGPFRTGPPMYNTGERKDQNLLV